MHILSNGRGSKDAVHRLLKLTTRGYAALMSPRLLVQVDTTDLGTFESRSMKAYKWGKDGQTPWVKLDEVKLTGTLIFVLGLVISTCFSSLFPVRVANPKNSIHDGASLSRKTLVSHVRAA